MANKNYPIDEIKDLVNQLVNITEILIDPPKSVGEELVDKLKGSQYETVQCIKALTEEH